tara:strand:+ start:94142 stop:94555 length:414 start_codon:yes stop_codon:yes gene_type:complete
LDLHVFSKVIEMADIKKLHKIIQEMGSDPNVSMHELVREVLKRDNDYSDYYLDNISDQEDENIDPQVSDDPPPDSENILQVQSRLENFLKQDQSLAKMEAYEREATTLETLERLKSKVKTSWTELVKPYNSKSGIDE